MPVYSFLPNWHQQLEGRRLLGTGVARAKQLRDQQTEYLVCQPAPKLRNTSDQLMDGEGQILHQVSLPRRGNREIADLLRKDGAGRPETGKEFPFSPLYLLLAPTVSCSKPLRHRDHSRASFPAHFPHRYRRSSIQVPVRQKVCPVSSLHLPSPAAPLIFFAAISSRSRHINKCHPSPNDKPLVSSTPSRRKGTSSGSSASRATTLKQVCDQCDQSTLPCDGANPCCQ